MFLFLLFLEGISVKDGLDFAQTTGLFSVLGWTARQFLAFRDLRTEVRQLKEWRIELTQTKKEQAEKNEIVQKLILTELKELAFDIRTIKAQKTTKTTN